MIRNGTLECPCCGHGMRAWFQTGVQTVLCPVCQVEVDTANVRQEEPAQRVRNTWHLVSALTLIWDRLAGYNTGHRGELTL